MTALLDDMRSGRISHPDGSLDSESLHERIKALHAEVEDETSRVELIALHDALMRTGDRRLVEQGRDPGPLREVWRRDHLSFLLAESLTGGEVDEAKLARVNAREAAAGRLHPDDCVHIRKAEARSGQAQESSGLLKKAARGFSRLFGAGAQAAPDPPPSAGEAPPALDLAYRSLERWQAEKMRPRLETLVEAYRDVLIRLDPGEDFQASVERETLAVGRWFEDNENGFVAEAVSYVEDEILQGLKAVGLDGQFGSAIFQSIDEARAELARRMYEAREAAR